MSERIQEIIKLMKMRNELMRATKHPHYADDIAENEFVIDILQRNIPMKATRKIASERTKDPANGGFFGKGVTIWFCPKCGIFNTPTHKFCWKCGQALEFDTTATEPKGEATT